MKQWSLKRKLVLALALLGLLMALGGSAVWWWINQPMYRPGKLAERSDLDPPVQRQGSDGWLVTDDVSLDNFHVGTGRNVLVVHGGPGIPTRSVYPGLSGLTDRFRFHYYDQRGCGRSSRPIKGDWSGNRWTDIQRLEGTLGLGEQIADVERVRRILGDQRIILIGQSYGGFIAALYAAEFSQNVAALVLVAPADLLTLPSLHGDFFAAVRSRLEQPDQGSFDAWKVRYLDLGSLFEKEEADLLGEDIEFCRFFELAAGLFPFEPVLREDVGTWMIRAQYFSMGMKHDYRDALARIEVPVLVISGKEDVVSSAVASSYAELLPNGILSSISGAGHFPQYENPVEFQRLVSEFLTGLH